MAFDKFAGVEQFEAAVKAGQETWAKAFNSGRDAAQKAYKNSQDAFAKSFDKALSATSEQVQKSWPAAAPQYEEAAAWQKEQIAAMFKTSESAQKGVEKLAEEVSSLGQEAWMKSVEATKALMGAKTYQDWIEMQTEQARAAFDDAVAYSTKVSELAVKIATEVSEPMQAEFNKAAAKATAKPAAAKKTAAA